MSELLRKQMLFTRMTAEVRQIAPEVTDLAARVVILKHHKTIKTTGRARHVPVTRQAALLIALAWRFAAGPASARTLGPQERP